MDKDVIYIVSGLPRSGTSLMMRMLHEGGLEPLTDDVRKADIDNPRGYYEFERVKKLPEDTKWLPQGKGRVVKVLAELIKHLPPEYKYKIVFMMRDIDEVISSQRKMIIRRGEDPDETPDEEMAGLLRAYLKNLKIYISKQSNMEICYISYNDIMRGEEIPLEEIDEFFQGELDMDGMKEAIDKKLYRNRNVEL